MISKSENHFLQKCYSYKEMYAKQSVCFLTLPETTLLYHVIPDDDYHQYRFNIQIKAADLPNLLPS